MREQSTKTVVRQPVAGTKKPVAAKSDRIVNAIGSLHPAAVHLPMGLLLASGLFALFSLRGNFVMSDCAYYCLWLGTIGAVFACVSGWWFSPMENQGTVTGVERLAGSKPGCFLAPHFGFVHYRVRVPVGVVCSRRHEIGIRTMASCGNSA